MRTSTRPRWRNHERLSELVLRPRRRNREQLVELALPFAERVARRFEGEPLQDLEQVARWALIKTVDQYDPACGSFTACAAANIRGQIKRHLRDHRWGVHVPRRLSDLRTSVARATAELTAELARAPTSAELTQRLDASESDVLETVESVPEYRPASLNAAVGEGATVLGDLIGQRDGGLESLPDRLRPARLLGRQPERERLLLALRFHGNLTQAETAEEMGMSQMHVSRSAGPHARQAAARHAGRRPVRVARRRRRPPPVGERGRAARRPNRGAGVRRRGPQTMPSRSGRPSCTRRRRRAPPASPSTAPP